MEWKDLKDIVGKSAPILGGLLGGPVGAGVGGLISNVLGVKGDPMSVMTELTQNPEAVLKLKQIQLDHKQKLEELKLEEIRILQKRYESAHQTYNKNSNMADKIAVQVIRWNLPVIFLLVAGNLYIVDQFKEDPTLIAIASNIIGIAIGKLFSERQAVINFFFGSSIGSKDKDIQISNLKVK